MDADKNASINSHSKNSKNNDEDTLATILQRIREAMAGHQQSHLHSEEAAPVHISTHN